MELPQRKNHRLKQFDYGGYGYYYVTVCVKNRENILCDIVGDDATVVPSEMGKKVIACWNNIAILNENVEVNKFVLMPNHIHGILVIKNVEPIEEKTKKYAFEITERRGRRSLQGLIKDFKSVTTRYFKKLYNTDMSLWQESFYEEIIKSREQYSKVWQYIDTNPIKWQMDELNDKKIHPKP